MIRFDRALRSGLAVLAFPALLVKAALALDPPHDPTNLRNVCAECHTTHASYGTLLDPTVGTTVENLCTSCHYPGGPGPAAVVHACVGAACAHPFTQTCTACHDPHNQDQADAHGSTYGKLVRDAVPTPAGALRPVTFLGDVGAKSFADGDAVIDGVCEVCHTQTVYHTQNGAFPASHLFADLAVCTNCHTHTASFVPDRRCNSCHDDETGGAGIHLGGRHALHVVSEGLACVTCHRCVVNAQKAVLTGGKHANLTPDVCGNFNYSPTSRTCTGTGCHGAKSWNGLSATQDTCRLCHGDEQNGRLPDRHQDHLGAGIACNACHSAVTSAAMAITDRHAHMNGGVSLDAYFHWSPQARTCSNFTCHGETHGTESW